jgi:hypothetical protein
MKTGKSTERGAVASMLSASVPYSVDDVTDLAARCLRELDAAATVIDGTRREPSAGAGALTPQVRATDLKARYGLSRSGAHRVMRAVTGRTQGTGKTLMAPAEEVEEYVRAMRRPRRGKH